jgi:hypothetical protein
MAKVTLDSGRTVFTGLKYMYITPWVENAGGKGLMLADKTYEVVNIVGDTTSLEQEDNDVQEVEHEFSSTPLYEAVTLGKKTFTAECADYQEDVLVNLFGWDKGKDGTETKESVIQYAPTGYKEFYAAIELGFNSSEKVVVLPKVRLDSKVALASMKTDISRATITGSCYEAYIRVEDNEYQSDMFITTARLIPQEVNGVTQTAYTLSEEETKS